MMRNTLVGISNYDAENRTFDYQGHNVKFDGHYLIITPPDGRQIVRQHMSWQAPPRTDDMAIIDIAKHIVWELIDEALPSDWNKRIELERQMEELTESRLREELDYCQRQNDYFVTAYKFRDHIIKVHYDVDSTCPWDDWDGEPIAIASTDSGGEWKTEYGKTKISIYGMYKNIDEETAMRYIGIMLRGIARPFWTSGGGNYIAVWTGDEIEEHFGGDYHMAARSLKHSVDTFKAWAEGEVYGYMVDQPDGEGEAGDSCWGFYGDDYGYMLESAMEYVNDNADRLEREAQEADEEVMSMMESELGFHPTREGALT